MRPLRAVLISLRGLLGYPVRTGLAILGIMISTMLVVFLLAVLYNFKVSLVGQIQSVGVQQIVVVPGKLLNSGKNISQVNLSNLMSFSSVSSTLTYKDALDVRKELPEVVGAAPQAETLTHMSTANKSIEILYTGTTADYADMFSLELEEGRFLTEQETVDEEPVMVLGQMAKQLLFGEAPAVGNKVTVKGLSFTVVGVLKDKQLIGFNFNERAYTGYPMAVNTANLDNASMIFFKAQSVDGLEATRQKIAQVIARNHGGIQDFGLMAPEGALHVIDTISNLVAAIAVGITGISFLVGGLGIMNVMLLTVKERTREIGIRKAVGAKWWDILLQFLLEGMYISIAGCLLGLVCSYGGLLVLHHYFPVLSTQFPAVMVSGCVLFSLVLGLAFGTIPAIKALRIKPIDALRYE